MTLETADKIAGHLDAALSWPYVVLPILHDLCWNGWRIDVVNAESKARLTVIDMYGRMVEHTVRDRAKQGQ